jgi:hypothetical protein
VIFSNGGLVGPSKDAPRVDCVAIVAIVGLRTDVILCRLVGDWCSTEVPRSSVDWNCGVVGAAAMGLGTADNGVEVFGDGIGNDRDGL